MDNKLVTVIIIFILLACGVTAVIGSQVVSQTAVIAAEELARPESGMDLVVRSRTTAPANNSGRVWLIAIFMAFCVAMLAGYVLYERARVERIRQQRLAQKQQQRLRLPPPVAPPPLRLNGQSDRPYSDNGGPRVHH